MRVKSDVNSLIPPHWLRRFSTFSNWWKAVYAISNTRFQRFCYVFIYLLLFLYCYVWALVRSSMSHIYMFNINVFTIQISIGRSFQHTFCEIVYLFFCCRRNRKLLDFKCKHVNLKNLKNLFEIQLLQLQTLSIFFNLINTFYSKRLDGCVLMKPIRRR